MFFLKKHMKTLLLGFVLLSFTGHALAQTILYQENFSNDPGFTSQSTQHAYWDAGQGNYYVKTKDDLNYKYFAYKKIPLCSAKTDKLTIEFDILFENQDWGTYPGIRFYANEPTDIRKDPVGELIVYNAYHNDKVKQIGFHNKIYEQRQYTPQILNNIWYTINISSLNGSTDIIVKNKSTNSIIYKNLNSKFTIGDFSYIGIGYYDQADYGKNWSPIRIDNITISTSKTDTIKYYGNFALTAKTYAPNIDHNQAVRTEIGPNYRAADWNDIVNFYNNKGSASLFQSNLDISAFVTFNEKKWYDSTRHYFYEISQRAGKTPIDSFLSHANVGNHAFDLGSWTGNRKILAFKIEDTNQYNHSYIIPYSNTMNGFWTGIGLCNIDNKNINTGNALLYDTSGNLKENMSFSIPANGQLSSLLGMMMTQTIGWAQINTSQPITGLSFVGTSYLPNHMADIPLVNINDLASSYVIPHVAQDTSWNTSLLLCNPGANTIDITITSFNKDGALVNTKTVKIPVKSSIEHKLSLHGSFSGSVKITGTGNFGGFALYDNTKSGGKCYSGINTIPTTTTGSNGDNGGSSEGNQAFAWNSVGRYSNCSNYATATLTFNTVNGKIVNYTFKGFDTSHTCVIYKQLNESVDVTHLNINYFPSQSEMESLIKLGFDSDYVITINSYSQSKIEFQAFDTYDGSVEIYTLTR